jgi:hypothetical protein
MISIIHNQNDIDYDRNDIDNDRNDIDNDRNDIDNDRNYIDKDRNEMHIWQSSWAATNWTVFDEFRRLKPNNDPLVAGSM